MTHLHLTLLGASYVKDEDQQVIQFRSRKAQALLIYLAVMAGQSHERDQLMAMFYPDTSEKAAVSNLRQLRYQIRQAVPAVSANNGQNIDILKLDGSAIRINQNYPYTLDIDTFAAALATAANLRKNDWRDNEAYRLKLEEVAGLYQGHFLTNFYLTDSEPFEEWAQSQRDWLRYNFLDALSHLTDIALYHNNYKQAHLYAERQLATDNLRELAYRQLMEILARRGQISEALVQYEKCARALRAEMSMAPSVKTTALYEQIRSGNLDGDNRAKQIDVRGYILGEKIAAGAFGEVYQASQAHIGREVAIKVIRPRYAAQPEFIRRFEAEARLVARLEHPYIVPLYDYWREPSGAYLVMRWLSKGTLKEAMQGQPWTTSRILRLTDQLSSALDIAHRHGIVHRDIKPANILLDLEDNAYLSDFGIAKDVFSDSSAEEDHGFIGTPSYISPEQILSEPVSPQTDIYAYGLILFELLTGQKPFPGASLPDLIYKHLNEALPSAHELQPKLPPAIDQFIQRATAKGAKNRYPNILALREALYEIIGADQVTSHETQMLFDPNIHGVNPYRGLRAFQEGDADLFYGRSVLVQQLLNHWQNPNPLQRSAADRFLAVVGPSGSGKSSVVRAGLIPALRSGELPDSERWFVTDMTPGSHPFEELETALRRVAVDAPDSLLEPLQKDERGLIRILRHILPDDGQGQPGQLLLFIDQFEELFTLVTDDDRRHAFLKSLLVALNDVRSQLRIIITIRADFYDRPLQYGELGELLRLQTEVVLPLNPTELEEAIRIPAMRSGTHLEDGLIAAIIADVTEQPGALPLLQYTLTELYEERKDQFMTNNAYRELGGVLGAIGRRAEELYTAFDPAGQTATRQLFLRLVTLGEGSEDTRRRVLRTELEDLLANGQQSTINSLLTTFADHRLLTFDRDPITRGPTVEVAHEALLREWPRLRRWLDESRDDIRRQQRLAQGADEWETHNNEDSFLLRGALLAQFSEWIESPPVALTPTERHYLQASRAARQERLAAEETRRQRELETAQQLAEEQKARAEEQTQTATQLQRRAVYLAVVLVIALVAAVTAGLFGQQARTDANTRATAQADARSAEAVALLAVDERATAQAQAETNQMQAEANALAESQARATADAETVVRAAAEAEANTERALAEQRNEELLENISLQWALQANNTAQTDSAKALAIALAAADIEQAPPRTDEILENLATASGLREVFFMSEKFPDVVDDSYAFTLSPDRQMALMVNGVNSPMILWDINTGEEIRQFEKVNCCENVYFHPDGQSFIGVEWAASDRIYIWDINKKDPVRVFLEHSDIVAAAAFSPDGRTVASGTFGIQELLIWDFATGEVIHRLDLGDPLNNDFEEIRFTHDGRRLVVSNGLVGEASVWDVASGELIYDFVDTSSNVLSIEISPDDQWAFTGGANGQVQIWDLASGEEIASGIRDTARILDLAVTPDGWFLITVSDSGLKQWQLTDFALVKTIDADAWLEEAIPEQIEILAGGQQAMVSSITGTGVSPGESVAIWDLYSSKIMDTYVDHRYMVMDLTFTPDGAFLLSASMPFGYGYPGLEADNRVRMWDVATSELVRSFDQVAGFTDIDVNSEGTILAVASQDGTVPLWDINTGEEIGQFVGHTMPVLGVDFSPDGQLLASGGADEVVILWDVETGTQLHTFEKVRGSAPDNLTNFVGSVRFSPDGKYLAINATYDIVLWDLATYEVVRTWQWSGASPRWGWGLEFTPDSRLLLAAQEPGGLQALDIESGEQLYTMLLGEGHAAPSLFNIAVHPDGQHALIGDGEAGVLLFDIPTGNVVERFQGHNQAHVGGVAFSPDGTTAVSGGGDMRIISWDLLTTYEGPELRTWIADNRYVSELTCADRVQFQIEPLCEESEEIAEPPQSVTIEVLIQDAQEALAANDMAQALTLAMAAYEAGDTSTAVTEILKEIAQSPGVQEPILTTYLFEDTLGVPLAIAISPDNRTAALGHCCANPTTIIWDMETGNELHRLEGHQATIDSLLFTPDGTRLISGARDGLAIVWDVTTGTELLRFEDHDEVTAMAISPDGQFVATGGLAMADVFVWDIESGEVRHHWQNWPGSPNKRIGHRRRQGVVFSPDGRYVLASGSERGTATIWSMETGEVVFDFPELATDVRGVAFSPDGQQVVTSSNGRYFQLWQVEDGQLLHEFRAPYGSINYVAFTPDGQWIMAISRTSDELVVWDSTTYEVVLLDDQVGDLNGWAISPDSQKIQSVYTDLDTMLDTDNNRFWHILTWDLTTLQDTDLSLPELVEWLQQNRHVGELSCEEQLLYGFGPCP